MNHIEPTLSSDLDKHLMVIEEQNKHFILNLIAATENKKAKSISKHDLTNTIIIKRYDIV